VKTVDPFFSLPQDPEWNACIGRQGDEENYVDGYIAAAYELATAVIDKGMYEKRDTLVLPILYNARHAIELTQKLVIGEFVRAGVLSEAHPANHDIRSHFLFLVKENIADEAFRSRLAELEPFVESLAQIDEDGQELRYHKSRDGTPSLESKALANIATIRDGLLELSKVLSDLKYRSFALSSEWATGTRTSKCSRRDLFQITDMLPARKNWKSEEFCTAKKLIKARYSLSNRQYSLALDMIQETRVLGARIGVEFQLIHLSDEKAEFLLNRWSDLHPPRSLGESRYFDCSAERDWDAIRQRRTTEVRVISEIVASLSEDEFADAETVFYLARDKVHPEYYQRQFGRKKKEFAARSDLRQEVLDLMGKTNFQQCFCEGLRLVGRIGLADRLNPKTVVE